MNTQAFLLTALAMLLFGAIAPRPATAQEGATAAAEVGAAQLTLRASKLERMSEHSGRYGLQGRFNRVQDAAELRESGDFVLIGRFTKAAVGCDANSVFRNGFEG